MGTVHKTFQVGEVLSSADVNDGLNPSTADHLAYAVAAGTVNVPCTPGGSNASTSVTFPAGRFTKTPSITATLNGAAGGTRELVARVWGQAAASVTVGIYNPAGNLPSNVPTTVAVSWIAIQMDA